MGDEANVQIPAPTGEREIYKDGLRIAIQGCGHGTLNAIYASIEKVCARYNDVIDLLIICGDFQAVRNACDLHTMAVPDKYKVLGDFHEYYSGVRKAPILTLFIGGNHEASAYNTELFYGGWVCPNIYYMGAANVVNVGGLRIAGLSGIYSAPDYNKPHYERVPYMGSMLRSVYHVRAYDVFKLYQVPGQIDIGLSHDWPQGIEHNGDAKWLLQNKPWFGSDIKKGELGSPPARSLLYKWRPKYWFSGHLHVKFAAIVHHAEDRRITAKAELPAVAEEEKGNRKGKKGEGENPDRVELELDDEMEERIDEGVDAVEEKSTQQSVKNADEIDLDFDEDPDDEPAERPSKRAKSTPTNQDEIDLLEDVDPAPAADPSTPKPNDLTYFLALDKCLPHRAFLQVLKIPTATPPPSGPLRTALHYDPDWLAITRALNPYLSVSYSDTPRLPTDLSALRDQIAAERAWVDANIQDLRIPTTFSRTAPATGIEGAREDWRGGGQPREFNNPQTQAYCEMLGIENKFWVSLGDWEARKEQAKLLREERIKEKEKERQQWDPRWGKGGREAAERERRKDKEPGTWKDRREKDLRRARWDKLSK
ncbi:lariat debranching enzyme, C-terminal domain-containing protein [Kalaharituber pfeilii]|nr:lariat debranching enzyme, C-terminal domain-containing protein [Kalaharituber pfeilii]